jgi:hypothetical protein
MKMLTQMRRSLRRRDKIHSGSENTLLLPLAKGVSPYNTSLPFNSSTANTGSRPLHFWGSEITLRHTTLGRTPLDEWSAHRTNLYLKRHTNHKRRASMPPAGFEPVIPSVGKDSRLRPHGHWDRNKIHLVCKKSLSLFWDASLISSGVYRWQWGLRHQSFKVNTFRMRLAENKWRTRARKPSLQLNYKWIKRKRSNNWTLIFCVRTEKWQ